MQKIAKPKATICAAVTVSRNRYYRIAGQKNRSPSRFWFWGAVKLLRYAAKFCSLICCPPHPETDNFKRSDNLSAVGFNVGIFNGKCYIIKQHIRAVNVVNRFRVSFIRKSKATPHNYCRAIAKSVQRNISHFSYS